MLIEVMLSWVDKWGFVVSCLNLLALITFSYLTYQLARDKKDALVSFSLNKIEDGSKGHISYKMNNNSLVNVEVWSKCWIKIENKVFSDNGFYGNKSPWFLQPFTEGYGHFRIGNFETEQKEKLSEFIKEKSINSLRLKIQIRYKRIGKGDWKKSPVHTYFYDLVNERFWLDV
jgi:hypothetical protein